MITDIDTDSPAKETNHTKRPMEFENFENCAKRGRLEDIDMDDCVVVYNRFQDENTEDTKDYWPQTVRNDVRERNEKFSSQSHTLQEMCSIGSGLGDCSDTSSIDSDYFGSTHLDHRHKWTNEHGCNSTTIWSNSSCSVQPLDDDISGDNEEATIQCYVRRHVPYAYARMVNLVQNGLSARNQCTAHQVQGQAPIPAHRKLQLTTGDSSTLASSTFQAVPMVCTSQTCQIYSDSGDDSASPVLTRLPDGIPPMPSAPYLPRYGPHAWSMKTTLGSVVTSSLNVSIDDEGYGEEEEEEEEEEMNRELGVCDLTLSS